MEQVLIVAKTHMQTGVCTGGLVCANQKNVRLLSAQGWHQPEDTALDVGQLWEMKLKPKASIVPPHVEDMCVCEQRFVRQQRDMRETLLALVLPWEGGPEILFNGLLIIGENSAYIARGRALPAGSTGYWLPNRPLTLAYRHGKPYYRMDHDLVQSRRYPRAALYISYVGYTMPVMHIRPKTLVRVSLSRWWVGESNEERCYLQLSGWYG